MASTDALPISRKGVAFRVTFPILDADGDLQTGAASLDSEVSKDGGTFADCTNEATEIATSSGMYFLDLTSTEMDADCVAVIVKTGTAGAKTTPMVFYPLEDGDWRVNVVQFGGTNLTAASGIPEVKVASIAANAITATAINADAITAAKIADGAIDAATFAAGAINAAAIASDAITAAKVADGAIDAATFAANALDAVWSVAARILTAATNITSTGGTTVPQTGDSFARLGAPAGASVSADIAAIEAQTDDIGAAGAGLTAVPWNAAWDADVQSEVQDAIEVNHLDHLLAVTYDPASKPGAADALLNELVESDAGVARYTVNALEQGPSGSGASAATIADAVWDEVAADHVTAGTTGKKLTDAGAAGDPWATAVPGAYGAGTAGKILGDNVNATISSRASQTSVDDLPTNAELATALGTADDAILAAIAALNNLSQANIRTAVGLASANLDTQLGDVPTNAELSTALAAADDAILAAIAALNNLSTAGVRTAVGLASANLDTQLSAIAGFIDAEVASILAAVDTEVAAIKAKTDGLPSDPADQSALESALTTAQGVITTAIAALNNVSTVQVRTEVDAALDSTVPDAVPADGTRPSMRQAAYISTQFLLERAVSGTTLTIRKADGSTALLTLTLNDATTPTAVTRAS